MKGPDTPTNEVEEVAAVDVAGVEQLADVPLAAGLVLELVFGEDFGSFGEVPAEDDGVSPDVAGSGSRRRLRIDCRPAMRSTID